MQCMETQVVAFEKGTKSLHLSGLAARAVMYATPALHQLKPAALLLQRNARRSGCRPVQDRGRAILRKDGTFPFVTDFILGDTRSLTHVAGGLHSPKIRASGLRFAQKPGSCLFVNRPMPRSCIAPMNGS